MPEAQIVHDRQVGLQERIEQGTLYDVTWVGGAPLLPVFESPLQMLGHQVPLAEPEDPPRVQTLLLQKVPSAGVGQGGGGLAAVGPTPDERQRPQAFPADQYITELRPDAGDQGDGQPGAAHQCVGQGEAVESALTGVFAITALPARTWTSSACTCTLIG